MSSRSIPAPRRTIPYISKVTGVPMVDLATRAMLGEKLKDMGYGTGLYQQTRLIVAVKVPVLLALKSWRTWTPIWGRR